MENVISDCEISHQIQLVSLQVGERFVVCYAAIETWHLASTTALAAAILLYQDPSRAGYWSCLVTGGGAVLGLLHVVTASGKCQVSAELGSHYIILHLFYLCRTKYLPTVVTI